MFYNRKFLDLKAGGPGARPGIKMQATSFLRIKIPAKANYVYLQLLPPAQEKSGMQKIILSLPQNTYQFRHCFSRQFFRGMYR